MTLAAPTLQRPRERSESARASVAEFLWVGGVTLPILLLLWGVRGVAGLDESELAVGFLAFHGAHLINDPHFSVTYLLFYRGARERAFGAAFAGAQRIRYLFAGGVVPLVLGVWVVVALVGHSGRVLGALMQLMFLLVGWHYVKQGFGVLAVLSARHGVRFTATERHIVLGHCLAGWAYAWASPRDPGRLVEEKGLAFATWAHPPGLETATRALFFLSAGLLAWTLVRKRIVEKQWPPPAALVGFLVTVWIWTVHSAWDPLLLYVIPALHSVQYLYFVWLMRRNEALEAEGPPSFGKPVGLRLGGLFASALALGWLLFHGAPGLLDGALVLEEPSGTGAPGGLGPTPCFAALFAFVNIHHYFMDMVIWRRENPETRYLRLLNPSAPGES